MRKMLRTLTVAAVVSVPVLLGVAPAAAVGHEALGGTDGSATVLLPARLEPPDDDDEEEPVVEPDNELDTADKPVQVSGGP